MAHILERHHPEYWAGGIRDGQSFFSPKISISDITGIVENIMDQNRVKFLNMNMNGSTQISGKVNGIDYVLGVNRGRIGQLYPIQW
jgi:hypothetical protein